MNSCKHIRITKKKRQQEEKRENKEQMTFSVLGTTLSYIFWWGFSCRVWGMLSTPSLLPGPLWPGMVEPVRVPFMGQ